jgi:glycine C-acetyltransferase
LNYEKDTTLRDKLEWNTNYFKQEWKSGFDIVEGDSAVPVMLWPKLSQTMADELLKEFMCIGFFPVVKR